MTSQLSDHDMCELLIQCKKVVVEAERAWIKSVIGGLYPAGGDTPYTDLLRNIAQAINSRTCGMTRPAA